MTKRKNVSTTSRRRYVTLSCALENMFEVPVQLLPSVLKSAVQSSNTVVFVPSSFDFIRVHNYFRKHAGVTFTVLSEYVHPLFMSNHQLIFYRYSTNQDISRARQAFFKGSKSFLLVSERFHFYKRSVPPPFLIITANIDFAIATKSEESVMSYSMDPQTTRSISRSTYHTPSLTRGWSRRM
jgi:hypothetical protein